MMQLENFRKKHSTIKKIKCNLISEELRRAALKVFQEGKQDERFQILFLRDNDDDHEKGPIDGIANEKLDYALNQYLEM